MLRICIEIDGVELASTTHATATVATPAASTPPPEVAALGVQDAGPAPIDLGAMALGAPLPFVGATVGPSSAEPVDLFAGAAPGTPLEPTPAVTIEEDG